MDKRAPTPPSAVRRIMQKHGLPEPTARAIAALAYGDVAAFGRQIERASD